MRKNFERKRRKKGKEKAKISKIMNQKMDWHRVRVTEKTAKESSRTKNELQER